MPLRSWMKAGAVETCRALGLEAWSRNRLSDRLLVLCYHGVVEGLRTDRFGYENTVHAREFQGQLEFIARCFTPVTAAQVDAARSGGKPLPKRAALITFDDGYRNNLSLASGILRRVGVPAVFFLSSGYIGTARVLWPDALVDRLLTLTSGTVPLPQGGRTDIPPTLPERRALFIGIRNQCKLMDAENSEDYIGNIGAIAQPPPLNEELRAFLSWDEARALRAQGFEIGAHTVEHPILTRVSPSRRIAELTESRLRIERELGEPCPFVAYPNGGPNDVSPAVFEAARDAGYRLGFTLSERFSPRGEHPLALSRLCVQGHLPLSYFRFRASGAADSLKSVLPRRSA